MEPHALSRIPRGPSAAGRRLALAAALASAGACTGASGPTAPGLERDDDGVFCSVRAEEFTFVTAPDAIRALTDPPLVSPGAPGAAEIEDDDRVVGVLLGDVALAVPLGILRYHEIVNLTLGAHRIAVSYCPLTGSALTFDRGALDGAELGVSGILVRNNLVLYERAEEPSFFPQMRQRAQCGPRARRSERLPAIPSWELRWDAWLALHPGTLVVSRETGYELPYDVNLNEEYEELGNPDLLIRVPIDQRRPPKERVLGVPVGSDGGTAFPFGELDGRERATADVLVAGRRVVVLWDGRAEGAFTFYAAVDGTELDLHPSSDGYVDRQTGSTWRLDGLAVAGPLEGTRLEPTAEAYVAFWFAWADFHPETVVWRAATG